MTPTPPFLARYSWLIIAALVAMLVAMFAFKAIPQARYDAAQFDEWSEQ